MFGPSVVPSLVDLLGTIVRRNFTTETIRNLATFLTATLCHTGSIASPGKDSGLAGGGQLSPTDATFIGDARQLKADARHTAPLAVFACLHDLLLAPEASADLQKFAKVISEPRKGRQPLNYILIRARLQQRNGFCSSYWTDTPRLSLPCTRCASSFASCKRKAQDTSLGSPIRSTASQSFAAPCQTCGTMLSSTLRCLPCCTTTISRRSASTRLSVPRHFLKLAAVLRAWHPISLGSS